MKDFIEKLIERLGEESKKWLNKWDKERFKGRYDYYSDGMNDAFDESIEIVNQLAEEYKTSFMQELVEARRNCSEDSDCSQCIFGQINADLKRNNGWIPCSERLPEYTDEYNVTVDVASEFGCYKTVETLRFEKIKGREPKWVIPKDKVYRVIAWQPLPKPYKECER